MQITREERLEAERREKVVQFAAELRKRVGGDVARARRLLKNLDGDLAKHGDPEHWKRLGDILLANVSGAKREGVGFRVTDYFDASAPEIIIEADPRLSASEAAEEYFRRYQKARNGREMISGRIEATRAKIAAAEERLAEIEAAEAASDLEKLNTILPAMKAPTETRRAKKRDPKIKGVRRFVSSDGFEILVGKGAEDNDYLTTRLASARDTWLHAADHSGSHVVIRNPNRKEIPQRTLREAASLAAFYSSARQSPRAAVNYTERKFVNKVKGGAPGLVRLASFRTIDVRPEVTVEKIE
ncbi:MAG: putative RNA-binding protein [Acidobacteria bacterium OLB17]|nr:MAG: putative RNA-binding protein [Acidobacteria bacterium OLB17]MCZ2391347.1 NFACT RNA binding domain-containing protein [Acidobacteriota bacterium]